MKADTPEKVTRALCLRGFVDKVATDNLNVIRLEKELGCWTLLVWGRSYSAVFVDLTDHTDGALRFIETESVSAIIMAVKCVEDFLIRLEAIKEGGK
jgi:hypothetical protein